jgi:hypothetical protein
VDLTEKQATAAKQAPSTKSSAAVKKRASDDAAPSPAKVSKIADFFSRNMDAATESDQAAAKDSK